MNEHAEHQTLNWIGFSNAERLHEQLDDLPPTEYEELNYKTDNNKKLVSRVKEPTKTQGASAFLRRRAGHLGDASHPLTSSTR